ILPQPFRGHQPFPSSPSRPTACSFQRLVRRLGGRRDRGRLVDGPFQTSAPGCSSDGVSQVPFRHGSARRYLAARVCPSMRSLVPTSGRTTTFAMSTETPRRRAMSTIFSPSDSLISLRAELYKLVLHVVSSLD